MRNHVNTLFKDLPGKVKVFFLAPASPRPLGALRIGLAFILIVQAILIRNDILNFFARDGLVQGPLADYLSVPGTPQLSWLVDGLAPFGVSETICIFWVTRIYFSSLIFLLFGLGTRIASIVVFFLQWTFV